MKTKIVAVLLTLTFAASIGFPAAAEDASGVASFLSSGPAASAALSRGEARAAPPLSRNLTSDQFLALSDVRADGLSSRAMDLTRGAGGVWMTTTPSSGLLYASNNPDGRNLLRFDGSVDF
jgi:hypothetical protein